MLRSALVMWRLDWTGLVLGTECFRLGIPNSKLWFVQFVEVIQNEICNQEKKSIPS